MTQSAIPPREGPYETPNGVATITRQKRDDETRGDMLVVTYRGARVHIYRRNAGTWAIRIMDIGSTYTDSLPKKNSEASAIFLAIRDVDRTLRIREEAAARR